MIFPFGCNPLKNLDLAVSTPVNIADTRHEDSQPESLSVN